MAKSLLFDVKHQLTFYGAYHSNKWNVLIHIICVPLILWSAQVFLTAVPVPQFIPAIKYIINDYLSFEPNWAWVFTAVYLAYYLALEPVAALLYAPQLILSVSTATSFSHKRDGQLYAAGLHAISWIAQFIGHGFAEGRAPALLDNLVGAVVLAPFFVHLELLFSIGYNKELHKSVKNSIGVEVARIRKLEGDKKRAKEASKKDL